MGTNDLSLMRVNFKAIFEEIFEIQSINNSSTLAIDFIHNLDHPVIDSHLFCTYHEIVA